MMSTKKTNELLFRDGTSQQDRNTDAIRPEYIPVEDRSIKDLITEAQRLAKELRFFEDNNQSISGQTWESFLIEDAEMYHKASETGKKKEILREQWASQLVAYIEHPEQFLNDQNKIAKLSRPHVVLFMTFLKLLNHVKSQINGLTQKHLDFYFRERLSLTPKESVPDVVNVLLELVESIEYLEVKKGTVLNAGEDASGNKLHYETNEDTIISQAKIAKLKNIYVEKQLLTIREAHLNDKDTEDLGLMSMMKMAVGHPHPGDSLPDFPKEVKDLIELYNLMKQGNTITIAYIAEQLFLSTQDFSLIIEKHLEEKEGIPVDWKRVYGILDFAYKNKVKQQRQQELQVLHEQKGFDQLLKYVYGTPSPGDDLPLYKGEPSSLDIIFDDLIHSDQNSNLALEYIEEELKLKEQDFIHIVEKSKDQNATEQDINKIYRLLELANRQVRVVTLPSPSVEKLSDIYAIPDARALTFSQSGDEEESKRFKTFGNRLASEPNQVLSPATIGFAISSPTLLLKEGVRTIETLLDLGLKEDHDIDILQTLFKKNNPFQVYLSSDEEWFIPKQVLLTLGHYLGSTSEASLAIELTGNTITVSGKSNFSIADIGNYIVNDTNIIYEIIEIRSPQTVEVKEVGRVEGDFETPKKYAADQVYLNALKIEIKLFEDDPKIVPLLSDEVPTFIQSDQPSLVCALNHFLIDPLRSERYKSEYQKLMHLRLQKAHIQVNVQGIKDVVLQNDQSILDAKKPFEPFGFEPETGTSFYLANKEICQKKIKDLHLDLQWIKQPESFMQYYKNYWLIDENDPDLANDAYIIQDDSDFKAKVFLQDHNAEVFLEDIALFANKGKVDVTDVPSKIKESTPNYVYKQDVNAIIDVDDVLECDRYFRLELDPLDFQHSTYNTLFTKQALSDNQQIKSLKIHPPYQPKLKRLQIGYVAHTDIVPKHNTTRTEDYLSHIHPFGYNTLNISEKPNILPRYEDEGTLYIGISKLQLPQIISILFQMAEGSANPDITKPELQWSYLRDNDWIELKTSDILSDSTNGFINTGIIKINIPSDATTGGTLMPDTLHWLKVSVTNNIDGVSDTIDIRSQVISATLSSVTVDASHFETPLASETITESLISIPEIAKINQPYTSSKGKPAEQSDTMYKRLSERLRHKNRALTMWDYEHMVLNRFPEVYKTKCLPSNDEIGKVEVIVIPDIKGSLPFHPFSPKVAANTLFEIHEYLDQHSPAYAEVAVMNPFYIQVLTRCTVKFNEGYDEQFYKEKLIDEIKRFLSPWAYDQESDIKIGGSLHASVMINFIAERPYIDYVANLKLFQSEDGKTFTDVRSLNRGKSIVIPSRPDMVMVSGATHFIDIVDENGYNEDSFEGINYMQIQLDFEVAEDLK